MLRCISMKDFSLEWKSSSNVGKQRKYRANAPLHLKRKYLASHLSKELRKKFGRRSLVLRKGDKIRVMRGKFKGKIGKVENLEIKISKVFVTGIELTKKDGSKKLVPLEASNLLILEAIMEDSKRKKIIKRKVDMK